MTDYELLAVFALAAGIFGAGVLMLLLRDTSEPHIPQPPPDLDLRRLGK